VLRGNIGQKFDLNVAELGLDHRSCSAGIDGIASLAGSISRQAGSGYTDG
jgi:hypothetical protein